MASLADSADLFLAARDCAERGGTRISGMPVLLLSVPARNRLEIDLLQALTDPAPKVLATVLAGDIEALGALERVLRVEAEYLDKTAERDRGSRRPSRLDRLRSQLFADTPVAEASVDEDSSVELISAPSEEQECLEIARRIRLGVSQGVGFDQMVVALRSPEFYLPLVEEALRRSGVPAYFSHGTVRPDPAGRAFLALLECASEGLSASRFAEYLSLGQVPELNEEGTPPSREVEWVEPRDQQLSFKSLPLPEKEEEGDAFRKEPEKEAAVAGNL